MIGAYLIVAGVLAMAAGYISLMYCIVMRAERRDLAALSGTPLKPAPPGSGRIPAQELDSLAAHA